MVILGLDPGTADTGFGLIKCDKKGVQLVYYGSIKTSARESSPKRLEIIYRKVLALLRKYNPEVMVLESLFFNSNAKSAVAVGQAMGVLKLAAARRKIKVVDYPPLKIKMILTGRGRAGKQKIQERVKSLLKLRTIPRPTHAADALAVALCHWKEVRKNG